MPSERYHEIKIPKNNRRLSIIIINSNILYLYSQIRSLCITYFEIILFLSKRNDFFYKFRLSIKFRFNNINCNNLLQYIFFFKLVPSRRNKQKSVLLLAVSVKFFLRAPHVLHSFFPPQWRQMYSKLYLLSRYILLSSEFTTFFCVKKTPLWPHGERAELFLCRT